MKRQTTQQIDQLTERKHELHSLLAAHKSGAAPLSDDARRWAERELKHYRDERGDLATWAEKRARLLAIEASTAASVAEKEAKAKEDKERAEKQFAEIDAKIQAKLAQEIDPIVQYKRRVSDRTF